MGRAGGVQGLVRGSMTGAFGAPADRIIAIVTMLAFLVAVPISCFTFR